MSRDGVELPVSARKSCEMPTLVPSPNMPKNSERQSLRSRRGGGECDRGGWGRLAWNVHVACGTENFTLHSAELRGTDYAISKPHTGWRPARALHGRWHLVEFARVCTRPRM